ncbi:MAG: phosphoesterase, partial [Bacteroidetes bacterium]|nr:phosphoesterase [Bacteroidota bacterium]
MTTNIYKIITVLALFAFVSCEKDLPTYLEYEGYEFAGTDPTGGDWTPVLIQSGADILIPAPSATNSTEYLQEIDDLKSSMAQMSAEDEKAVTYWTQNPIIRWNEIALELVAKYNLIPGYNEDGTYTLPSPNNPAGPPPFPFAHPPYAVRALAYLSVAQFDGLISKWHHKYTYNRDAPFVQDPSIKPAYLDNIIPSYPSDGAVVATVSRKILTQMFPLEADYLAKKEAEHLKSLILSGANVQSDLDAGAIIGEAIADIALARAATDGMKKAQAPKPVSDSL